MSKAPKALEELTSNLENLPGIGPRSASRIAYFLLRAPERISSSLAESLTDIKSKIKTCKNCFNYSDNEICSICSDAQRSSDEIIVVQDPLDVMAFENTNEFKGLYHVLGGVISPINGVGPEEIRLAELLKRVKDNDFFEIIIATDPNLEGESTAIYIKRELDRIGKDITVSRLAMGLPSGADLEYADEITLRKALEGRVSF